MKERVLLDTNMLIYLLDDHVLDEKISKLTKLLYDSEKYSIVIHPNTYIEARKIRDEARREIFISKLNVYRQINDPPKATKEFNKKLGTKNKNDSIDNEMLFALERNCAQYFITNDKALIKKAHLVDLKDRVLSIEDAIEKFEDDNELCSINVPVFIRKEYLHNLDIEDDFFYSLRKDYLGFDSWFAKKQADDAMAYITKDNVGNLTSFLMIKEEDEKENYSIFEKPLPPAKRIKIATFKVADTGKKIGESFIKIAIKEALSKNVDEIYITTFEKQASLIYLIEQYGFNYYTYKNTTKSDGTIVKELVYVKNMKDKHQFPFVNVNNQSVYIFPVMPKYHKLLFEEAELEYQISINDTQGLNTSSNAIKKAFISNAKIKDIKSGDIVLFYASHDKKAITAVGVIEVVWSKFSDVKEISDIVRKRTAYNEEELQSISKLDSLVIMFKHCVTFDKPVSREDLLKLKIINGNIQRPQKITIENLKKIVKVSGSENMFEFNN